MIIEPESTFLDPIMIMFRNLASANLKSYQNAMMSRAAPCETSELDSSLSVSVLSCLDCLYIVRV